jgi:hypothetical protein
MASASFTEYLLRTATPWLLRTWGRRFLTVIGLTFDAYGDSAYAAVKARFIGSTPVDALPIAGEDRLLDRLLGETDDQYRARLLKAFPSYRQLGSSRGLQNRLHEAGYTTATVVEAHDWSTDDGGSWARYWIVLEQPHGLTAPEAWDTASLWSDGSTWADLSPGGTVAQILALSDKWHAGHVLPMSLIVVVSGELWDHSGTWADPGTWDGAAAYVSL